MPNDTFSGGWIKIYQSLGNHPVFTCGDDALFRLFIYCLLQASWKDIDYIAGNQVIHLKKGQFITGRKKLVKEQQMTTKEEYKDIKNNKTEEKRISQKAEVEDPREAIYRMYEKAGLPSPRKFTNMERYAESLSEVDAWKFAEFLSRNAK
jgi:hypothetical protein